MNKTTITLINAVTLLTEVVKRFGAEHVAKTPSGGAGCQYLVTASPTSALTPVCIVGQVFSDLGILRAMLSTGGHDQHEACNFDSPIWENAEKMGVTFADDARIFLREAQKYQDSIFTGGADKTWGGALNHALTVAQENALAEFKRQSGIFGGYLVEEVNIATTPKPKVSLTKSTDSEPLAEWERELLAGE